MSEAVLRRVLYAISQLKEVTSERDSIKVYLLKAEDRIAVLEGMVRLWYVIVSTFDYDSMFVVISQCLQYTSQSVLPGKGEPSKIRAWP